MQKNTAFEAVATILSSGSDTGYSPENMPPTHRALLALAVLIDKPMEPATDSALRNEVEALRGCIAKLEALVAPLEWPADPPTAQESQQDPQQDPVGSEPPNTPHPLDRDGDGQPGGSRPAADRLSQELLNVAALYGIEVDHRWSAEHLQALIADKKPSLADAPGREGGKPA